MRWASAWSQPHGRGWLVLGGALDLLLAILVTAGWPGTALWVLGALLGVHLLTMGFVMLFSPRQIIASEAKAEIEASQDKAPSPRTENDKRVETALKESFPASDPPGFGR